jgi:hypothetical protein
MMIILVLSFMKAEKMISESVFLVDPNELCGVKRGFVFLIGFGCAG